MEQDKQIEQCALKMLYENLAVHKNTREGTKAILESALDNLDKLADLFEVSDNTA